MNQDINWATQWESFAENFYDGFAHIDVTKYGNPSKPNLILSPGPGFGDLSHPTTQLMLQIMKGQIEKKSVLDVGCGSGILSLAAKLLGATAVCGVDIDEDALLHAKCNAKANDLENSVAFSQEIPTSLSADILLMNMIVSEQKVVMNHKNNSLRAPIWILSGVLEEQLISYLKVLSEWNLEPLEMYTKDGWMGFLCTPIST